MGVDDEQVDLRPTWFNWPGWLSRRTRRIVLAALVLAGGLAWFAPHALDHAHHAHIDCVNHLYETGRGDPTACLERAWLIVPKLVPWTRHRANRLDSEIAYDVAEDRLKVASLRDLDAGARDRAARALVNALLANPPPKPFFTTSSRLQNAGAAAILVERAAQVDALSRNDALASAVRLGDAEGLARLVSLPPDRDPHHIEVALGAAACAEGDRARGVDLLRRADAEFVANTGSHSQDASFALAACDPKRAAALPIDEGFRPQLSYLTAVCGGPIRVPSDAGFDPETKIAMLELSRDVTIDELLHVIYPRSDELLLPRGSFLSPWSLLTDGITWPIASQSADEAATRLIQLAATAKPEQHHDDVEPFEREVSDEARANPAAFLRWGALVLELEAAYDWSQRGELDKARTSADRAFALARDPALVKLMPQAPVIVVSTLELAGDWDAALAALGSAPTDEGDDPGTVVDAIQRALALAHRGRMADAYGALDGAMHVPLPAEMRAQMAWLRAALALAVGKQPDMSLPPTPSKVDINSEPLPMLAYWLAAAHATADDQAGFRWHSHGEIGDAVELGGVMPAVYFVVGRAAGRGNVELWLDAVTQGAIDDPQLVASARAEAARWRGDAAAAKRWDDRLARIRALAHDDCSAYLLGLVTKH